MFDPYRIDFWLNQIEMESDFQQGKEVKMEVD